MQNNIKNKLSYFDNAATTYPKPQIFYDKIAELFKNIGFNSSRSIFKAANDLKNMRINLENYLIKLLGCNNGTNTIFTASNTLAFNQIIQGLNYKRIQNIYISPFEHNAVYRPLLYMNKKHKFKLKIIPFSGFNWESKKTELLFSSFKPDVVILNHASNVFGNILPINEIFNLSKKYEALNILDAAQTVGLVDINMKNNKIDFLVFAGHKTLYGPSGIGGFVYNTNYRLEPILYGGTGINSENEEMPDQLPEKYEVGSTNSLGIIGLYISVKWLLDIGVDSIRKNEMENKKTLQIILNNNSNIKFFDYENSVGIVSCRFKNYSSSEIGEIFSKNDIAVRTGLHCAPLAHKHMNTFPEGTVRFSVGFHNTEKDFKTLVKVIKEI